MIRISGERQLLANALTACELPFTESARSQRNRRLQPEIKQIDTTYNLTASEADGNAVPVQVQDVETFLNSNDQRLHQLLRSIPGCRCTIDFSWDFPITTAGQYNHFPASLLARLGSLGIELVVSVYAAPETAANHPMQPSGEVGRFEVDDQLSPPADR